MSAWWSTLAEGTQKRVVLIQVDVGGHSKWLESAYKLSKIDAYKQRARLSRDIQSELSTLSYYKVFWAGDGGLFCADTDVSGHPLRLCEAADVVFRVFEQWRGSDKVVELRLTATTIELAMAPETGDWCSPDLNDFLKYERHIAQPNRFVITGELRASLTDQSRFPTSHRVPLSEGREIRCYIDSAHPYAPPKSPNSFGNWLSQKYSDLHISTNDEGLKILHGCTVLDTALNELGYGDFVFEPQQQIHPDVVLEQKDLKKWKRLKDDLISKKISGTSFHIRRFVPELSDDPHPRIDYSTIPYIEARAFHSLLEADSIAVNRYRQEALKVMGDGTILPNILSTAIVVIVGGDTPQLIIANRKSRTGGYHRNSWSVSIGEQFMPITGNRRDRIIKADSSLQESVRRGLREELLGDIFSGVINVSTQAFYFDEALLNFAFISLVDLRSLTFNELVSRWLTAVDRGEHQAIAALPATESVLLNCIQSSSLPSDIFSNAEANGCVKLSVGTHKLNHESHQWQPSSHLRLAAALWYVNHLT